MLAYAGQLACGDSIEQTLRSEATNVESIIIENSGHFPAEEQPEALLDALRAFLEPYAQGAKMPAGQGGVS